MPTSQPTTIPDSLSEKIDRYCAIREFSHIGLEQSSRVYALMVKENNRFLSKTPGRKGCLDQKQKILVLLAMHIASGNDQGIDFSVTGALQAGATEDEIMEILDLALLTGGGQAISRVQLAYGVLKYRQGPSQRARPKKVLDFVNFVAAP